MLWGSEKDSQNRILIRKKKVVFWTGPKGWLQEEKRLEQRDRNKGDEFRENQVGCSDRAMSWEDVGGVLLYLILILRKIRSH